MHFVLEDLEVEHLLAIAESFPEAKAPDALVAYLSGEDQSEFIEWWLPEQIEWQKRAIVVAQRLQDVEIGESDLPEWLLEWWIPIIHIPWSERLGEAVEAGESWLNQKLCP
jgi:hypothetical protein